MEEEAWEKIVGLQKVEVLNITFSTVALYTVKAFQIS